MPSRPWIFPSLKVVLTSLRYFPSATFEALQKVFRGFQMPAVELLPNARPFLRGES